MSPQVTPRGLGLCHFNVLGVFSGSGLQGGYALVDVANPQAPVLLEDVRLPDAPIGYPAVPAKNRGTVLVPVTSEGRLVLREYRLDGTHALLADSIDIAEAGLLSALGMAYDGEGLVLLAWPSARALVVVDLNSKSTRVVPWLSGGPGPADIAFR